MLYLTAVATRPAGKYPGTIVLGVTKLFVHDTNIALIYNDTDPGEALGVGTLERPIYVSDAAGALAFFSYVISIVSAAIRLSGKDFACFLATFRSWPDASAGYLRSHETLKLREDPLQSDSVIATLTAFEPSEVPSVRKTT